MAKYIENNGGLNFFRNLLTASTTAVELTPEVKATNEKKRIIQELLPVFCRELDGIAAQRHKRLDPLLRDLKYLSDEMIESKLLPLLDDSYIDDYCDNFLVHLAELGALDLTTMPDLYSELKMNVLSVKDNVTTIRIFEGLLKAVLRRNKVPIKTE